MEGRTVFAISLETISQRSNISVEITVYHWLTGSHSINVFFFFTFNSFFFLCPVACYLERKWKFK